MSVEPDLAGATGVARSGAVEPTEPGALILVVGPSGAGKDTILRGARQRLAGEPWIVFARRTVTRAADEAEDNETMSEAEFADSRARGNFLLVWQAHGLHYGVPISVVDRLRRGHSVVVNASRTVVPLARRLVARAQVVLITAPREIRAQRLAARGRDPDPEQRLYRDIGPAQDFEPDLVIDNAGPVETAVLSLCGFLRAQRA